MTKAPLQLAGPTATAGFTVEARMDRTGDGARGEGGHGAEGGERGLGRASMRAAAQSDVSRARGSGKALLAGSRMASVVDDAKNMGSPSDCPKMPKL